MAYDIAFLIGRILVGGYFLMSGFNHLSKMEMMTGYTKSKGLPMAGLMVPLSGVMMMLGGLSFLLGLYPLIGVILIVTFLVVASFKMHNFWAAPEDQKMAEMSNFMKNMGLIGSILMFLAIETPWALSLG